jgi:alkanesulfonate monooxygenase SsuD/methylene tetrahydromethanopterin reductase-like flavin-dependent oxidoreductase (luciferase family)
MSALKYGLTLPYNAALQAAELARMAEAAGWDGVFVGDAVWTVDPLIQLSAAAMTTQRIRLGTMVLAMPFRQPWHVASESLALDLLSKGRLTLGLGMGATWMGWKAFPDQAMDTKARAEMLDEAIDILTGMYLGKPFDYNGKHYRINLTLIEEEHYPPRPVQPRIPIWIPAVYPRKKSLARLLKCDGVFLQKMDEQGKFGEVTPADARAVRDYVAANRTLATPFDIIQEGQTGGLERAQLQEKLLPWAEAGLTWWVEGLWGLTAEQIAQRIQQGPPGI